MAVPAGFSYTTGEGYGARPCATNRETCPVQLFFKKGVPHLRFCYEKGKPGFVHAVKDPIEAQKLAVKACECWSQTRDFRKCARGAQMELGGLKRKKRRIKR